MNPKYGMMIRKPFAIMKKEFLVAISYKLSFAFQLSSIWLSLLVFYFLAKLINPAISSDLEPYGGDYFSFVIIGTAFVGYLNVGLDSFSRSIREAQLMGTLEAVLVTRTRLTTILIYQAVIGRCCLLMSCLGLTREDLALFLHWNISGIVGHLTEMISY